MHHQPWKVRALLLVGEERRVLRGDESLDVGVVEDALGSVVEPDDDVVGDVVDASDPSPEAGMDDVVPRAKVSHLRQPARGHPEVPGAVRELQVRVDVDADDDALDSQRVRRPRHDVAVDERPVQHPQLGVGGRLDAGAVRVEPAHLRVVVGHRGFVVVLPILVVLVGVVPGDARDEADAGAVMGRRRLGLVARVGVGDDVLAVHLRARVGAQAEAGGHVANPRRGGDERRDARGETLVSPPITSPPKQRRWQWEEKKSTRRPVLFDVTGE